MGAGVPKVPVPPPKAGAGAAAPKLGVDAVAPNAGVEEAMNGLAGAGAKLPNAPLAGEVAPKSAPPETAGLPPKAEPDAPPPKAEVLDAPNAPTAGELEPNTAPLAAVDPNPPDAPCDPPPKAPGAAGAALPKGLPATGLAPPKVVLAAPNGLVDAGAKELPPAAPSGEAGAGAPNNPLPDAAPPPKPEVAGVPKGPDTPGGCPNPLLGLDPGSSGSPALA